MHSAPACYDVKHTSPAVDLVITGDYRFGRVSTGVAFAIYVVVSDR